MEWFFFVCVVFSLPKIVVKILVSKLTEIAVEKKKKHVSFCFCSIFVKRLEKKERKKKSEDKS